MMNRPHIDYFFIVDLDNLFIFFFVTRIILIIFRSYRSKQFLISIKKEKNNFWFIIYFFIQVQLSDKKYSREYFSLVTVFSQTHKYIILLNLEDKITRKKIIKITTLMKIVCKNSFD